MVKRGMITQKAFIYSKSINKTLEKGVKYVLSLQKNTKKTPMTLF